MRKQKSHTRPSSLGGWLHTHTHEKRSYTAAVDYGFRPRAFPPTFPLTLTDSPLCSALHLTGSLESPYGSGIPQIHWCLGVLHILYGTPTCINNTPTHDLTLRCVYTHLGVISSLWEFTRPCIIYHMWNNLNLQQPDPSHSAHIGHWWKLNKWIWMSLFSWLVTGGVGRTTILWHTAGQRREKWQTWRASAGRVRGQANLRLTSTYLVFRSHHHHHLHLQCDVYTPSTHRVAITCRLLFGHLCFFSTYSL